jgi:hypothetical protein
MPLPLGISDSQKKQPPLPPSVVSQSDSGSGRAFDNGANFLTFQGTTFTGKLPIIDYTVSAIDTVNAEVITQTVNNVNPFVFTGLKSGRNYRFRIRARNAAFNSAESSEFGPGLSTTVPARTTSVGATNLGNSGGASLAWTAPANGGKAITSYLITPSIGSPVETGNSSTSYTFSGLTVGTGYSFTVAARNENGLGQASTTSNSITITAPAPTPPPTPPPTVGPITVGTTTVGSSVTCGACQVVSGNVQETACINFLQYTIYYEARAQVCSDGSQIPCTRGAEITRSGGTSGVLGCAPLVSTTYCPSLGYAVASSGYPCNCPGVPGCTTAVGLQPSQCQGPCSAGWTISGGVCSCPSTTVGVVTVNPNTVTIPIITVGGAIPIPIVNTVRRGGCLVSSTLISTPTGFVQAKDIKVGDLVHAAKFAELSTDETVDTILDWSTSVLTPTELTTSTVTAIVVKKEVDYYLNLNGDLVTPEHPVLVRHNGVHKFLPAGDIQLGYEVLKRNGDSLGALSWVPVTSNDVIEASDTVYLFDAEDDDVLFTANMLTHNFKFSGPF